MENKKKKIMIISLIVLIILLVSITGIYLYIKSGKNNDKVIDKTPQENAAGYKLSGNSLEDFDLYFMKLNNNKKNVVYSPLSIKYALAMLEEGASGNTKKQISSIYGSYEAVKYQNNQNMSFANALFIKDSYKDNINSDYVTNLTDKFNASILYDSFNTPDVLNAWVKNKTFNLIGDLFDDVKNNDFILTNALAIDMEWVNYIEDLYDGYDISFPHEKFHFGVGAYSDYDKYYQELFDGMNKKVSVLNFGAVANKYDIVKDIGEEKIRKTITEEYQKWLNERNETDNVSAFVDQYLKEIARGYNQISSSTDFKFYADSDLKVFAKDLKTSGQTTLQYVGIMPNNESLDNYIKNMDAKKINNVISNLKSIELNNFKEGVITVVDGFVPVFDFNYELNLMDNLKELGVTDVFDAEKANLSKITSDKAYISDAVHKSTISFSNYGIKAAAATEVGGRGDWSDGFEYLYDVPVEYIDLTFDRPYMFLIRDKNSGEIWFAGSVYEPSTELEKPILNEMN